MIPPFRNLIMYIVQIDPLNNMGCSNQPSHCILHEYLTRCGYLVCQLLHLYIRFPACAGWHEFVWRHTTYHNQGLCALVAAPEIDSLPGYGFDGLSDCAVFELSTLEHLRMDNGRRSIVACC